MTRTFFRPRSPPYPDFMNFFFFHRGHSCLALRGWPHRCQNCQPSLSPCVQLSSFRGPSSSSTARKSKLLLLFQDRGSKAPSQKASLFGSSAQMLPGVLFILSFPDLGKICSPSGERIGPFFFPFGRVSGVYQIQLQLKIVSHHLNEDSCYPQEFRAILLQKQEPSKISFAYKQRQFSDLSNSKLD